MTIVIAIRPKSIFSDDEENSCVSCSTAIQNAKPVDCGSYKLYKLYLCVCVCVCVSVCLTVCLERKEDREK